MSGRPSRIALVLPNLRLGGTQQVAMKMITHWLDLGRHVTVITWVTKDVDHFRLPPQVERYRLPEPLLVRTAHFVARLVEKKRPAVERPPCADGGRVPSIMEQDDALGSRPLDFARAAYRAWLAWRQGAVRWIVRRRLLGRSSGPYVKLTRATSWPARGLRRLLAQIEPDVMVSMLGKTNTITIAASFGLPYRTVISERNDPAKQRVEEPWNALRELLYPVADVVTANSHGALETMRAWCADGRLRYLPNPVHLPEAPAEEARERMVLFVARLMPQKAPEVLIEAFARFRRTVPDWRLDIVGAGPLGEALLAQVDTLGLSGCVTFHGAAEPQPLLARCGIFALPSRFEGTPNALLEAMSYRAACIVTDASPGPLQLVADGETGLVVKTDSVEDLAGALERLARDGLLRRRLGAAAFERVREFGIERVGPVWDRILFGEPDAACPAGRGD